MDQTIQPGDQMWVSLTTLIRDRVPDRKGNVLPADLASGTYDVQQIDSVPRSLALGSMAIDQTWGYQVAPPYANCCSDEGAGWNPDSFDLVLDGTEFGNIDATDSCTDQEENIDPNFNEWLSGDTAVANVTKGKVQAVGMGTTTGTADGRIFVGAGGYCAYEPVQLNTSIAVGQVVSLVQTACNTGFAELIASWGNPQNLLQCTINDQGPALPSGGSCVNNGTDAEGNPRRCYQLNTKTCSITYCPGGTRLVNSDCSQFIGPFPLVQVTVPAGCTQ